MRGLPELCSPDTASASPESAILDLEMSLREKEEAGKNENVERFLERLNLGAGEYPF